MTVGKRKRSKYGNRRVQFQGWTFDSILERDRWIVLLSYLDKGLIYDLERQPPIVLTAHGRPICTYRADFRYRIDGQEVWEDAKGVMTDVFQIKRKLFAAQTGKHINIVTKATLQSLPGAA